MLNYDIQPDVRLRPFIRRYFYIRDDSMLNYCQRVVPNGCVGLAFFLKRPANFVDDKGSNRSEYAVLQGIYNTFLDVKTIGVEMIAVDFEPFGARLFFDLPISELKGTGVPLRDIEDAELIQLEELIMEVADPKECIPLLDNFFLKRLSRMKFDAYNLRRIEHVLQKSQILFNQITVNQMAEFACLSPRQFSRVFSDFTGFSPKNYLRIIRFQKALMGLHLLKSSLVICPEQSRQNIDEKYSVTEIAWRHGYYDFSHMTHDFLKISGNSPNKIIDRLTELRDLSDSML